ncbi:NAD(+) salvage pathway protein [Ascosphaera atra]|nr:NAD(+) salvage pathway protein [Ascosphaera atra]
MSAPISMPITSNDMAPTEFRPALIVVDMQNDFTLPDGAMSVPHGQETVPIINDLIARRGFYLRIFTMDWHPADHVSFAASHPPPNNKPYESEVDMSNPQLDKVGPEVADSARHVLGSTKQRLWPVHGVRDTYGAEIVADLQIAPRPTATPDRGADNDVVFVRKGMDQRVEMYSCFTDAFGNMDCVQTGGVSHDVAELLKNEAITDVYVVGLAGELCVKSTALDAASAGFRTRVVEEGTRCVDENVWEETKAELRQGGVEVVGFESNDVRIIA